MSHTGRMPWDETWNILEKEYLEFFPEEKRLFSFEELQKKYYGLKRRKDNEKNSR